MKKYLFVAITLFLLSPSLVLAQKNRPYPYPVIPPPQFERAVENGTRTLSGEPGPNYWTNTAEYIIQATLSPANSMLRGEEVVRYYNNSPDELDQLILHLRQNLHKEGTVRTRSVQVTGGMQVSKVALDGQPLLEQSSSRQSGFMISGSRLVITLSEPLAPQSTIEVSIGWNFEVPETGAPRMGQDGEVFYLAFWYPQFAVYDDIWGWVADQYMGSGEFYMGYGDYDVSITVPEGWLVASTGQLQNPEAVLTEEVRDRLASAAQTSDVIHIVTEDEREAGTSTLSSPAGTLTWHFKADNVRDVAFGTSMAYLWDATSAQVGDYDGDGCDDVSMIHAFYRPEATFWQRSAEYGQYSIEFLSKMFVPYPYPHMTTVEGIIGGGMEFPMMTLIGRGRSESSLFGVTFHEIGHMWFPMLVGMNEKQYTWMDEGMTSFNTNEGVADFYDTDAWQPGSQGYYRIAGSGQEVESMRHGDRYPLNSPAQGIASYSKPAVALHALRGLFGQEPFYEAYRAFATRWINKHPYPYDFFNTFEDVLGHDLDWFWTTMFYETWTLDQAVANVEQSTDGVVVTIEDRGLSPFPVPIRVTYADGAVEEKTIPVETWLTDIKETSIRFEPGTVTRVEIDPEQYLPDVDRSNNTWER